MTRWRRALSGLREWPRALLAPAADPRETFAGVFERQQVLLRDVRDARLNIATARARLQEQVASGKRKLAELDRQARDAGRDDVARFARQLRRHAAEEIHALEAELESLRDEERLLPLVEDRIDAEIGALRAREEVNAARSTSAAAQAHVERAMSGLSSEIADLMHALHQTERRTEQLEARASAFDRLLDLGLPPPATHDHDDALARRLALRFAFEADDDEMSAHRPRLLAALDVLRGLGQEYARLRAVVSRHSADGGFALTQLPPLVDETYRQGVRALEAALELMLVPHASAEDPPAGRSPSPTDDARPGDLIDHADRCRSALQQARIDLAAMRASSTESRIDDVTASLRDTVRRAREVHDAVWRAAAPALIGGRMPPAPTHHAALSGRKTKE